MLETYVITLKEVVDTINLGRGVKLGDRGYLRHDKSIKLIEELSQSTSFGLVEKISITFFDELGREHQTNTLNLTKNQAIASGARLDNTMLMLVIDRLDRLERELTPMELMEKANLMILEELRVETLKKQEITRLFDKASMIECSVVDCDGDFYSMEEFCKVIDSKLDGFLIGRTHLYVLLRSMKLVMKSSTTPTQRGMNSYLDYRQHAKGFSTKIVKSTSNGLIRAILRHLDKNPKLNDVLFY